MAYYWKKNIQQKKINVTIYFFLLFSIITANFFSLLAKNICFSWPKHFKESKKIPLIPFPLQKKELLLETLWAWSYFFFFHNNLLCIMLFYYFMILGSNVTTKYFQMGHPLFLFLINPTIIEQLPIIQNKQKYCYWQLGENSK